MVTRRTFLKAAGAGAAAAAATMPHLVRPHAARGAAAGNAGAKPPNILFLLVDDQRNDTLGCAGHPILKTPHVDSLAARGVRFRNMFVTTSICAASRASILTGLHERTHRFTFGTPPIRKAHTDASYPVLLREGGYHTGFIGKFGVGVERGVREQMFDFFKPLGRNPYFKKQPDGSKRHITELCGDRAEEFLGQVPDGKPFCLSVSFNAVHAEDSDKKDHYPWPKAVDGMYDDVDIPPPRLGDPKYFEAQPEFLKESLNRKRWFWRWDTPEKYEKNMRAYFRMISGVDRVVGRMMKALERAGVADNTVVIYTGDNGYYMGDRGFAGKWSHYEQSLRVPLIVYDPRLPEGERGRVVDPMALNVDLPATMLDLAGLPVPDHYTSHSLVSILRGKTPADWRTDFFCEHLMDHGAIPKWEGVRGKRYVYARYFEQEPVFEFLHDLETDPTQLKNFAGDAAHADTLAAMRKRCLELRDAYGGPYTPRKRKK
jgi:arylsulfatase A-like enzyme